MTSAERVAATIRFEKVDQPAVFPLEGSAWICKKHGLSYEEMYKLPDLGAQLLVDGFKEMKSDAIFVGGSGWMAWANAFGSPVHGDVVGAPLEVGPAFTDPANELPDLTDDEIREKLQGNYFVQCMLKQIAATRAIVGDEIPLMSGHDGPFTACGILMGMSEFMIALAMEEEYVPKLIDFAVRCLAIYADMLVEAGATILNCCDPVSSGDMVAEETFVTYDVPALRAYTEKKVHKDIPVLVHICGNSGSRTAHLRDLGMSFFSVDSMVDIEECMKVCDHKMVMVGNINPSAVMLQGTPDDVYNNAMTLLELGRKNGGGIIPCTGCELPADSPLENILSLSRAAVDFAKK